MRYTLLVGPVAALLAAAAFAQTDTTTQGMGTDADRFGQGWPSSAADAFFDESRTLRGEDEISSRWQTLPQSDRDMIEADCRLFLEEHGDTAASTTTPGAGTEAGTESAAGTDTVGETAVEGSTQTAGTTGSDTSGAATGSATTGTAGTDATLMAGYDLSEMREICETIGDS